MARFLKPLVRSGGYYPSRRWTPLVYPGGYTTANGGEEPAPPPIEKTVTGNPIHITDALAKPAQALSVKLEPIQDLHGYDNPWPAGGGKNLLKTTLSSGTVNNIQITVNDDGTFTLNGNASSYAYLAVGKLNVNASTSYRISPTLGGLPTSYYYRILEDDFAVWSAERIYTPSQTREVTLQFVFPSNASFNNLLQKPMIRLASVTDATFAPYENLCPISGHTDADVIVSPTLNPLDGTTYPIPLGQTVYGGTLDVVTGVLTVDRAIVDMGTLNWIYYSAQQRIVAQVNSGKPAGANVGLDGACSVYKVVNTAYRQAPDKSIVIGNNFISNSYAAMVVHDENYTDAATFKTAVSGHTLVYPIKTPATYQLTPTEVTLLLGENNLFSDGEMTLVYLADGNASDVEALNILLGGRYVNNHEADEPTDREALDTLLGGTR